METGLVKLGNSRGRWWFWYKAMPTQMIGGSIVTALYVKVDFYRDRSGDPDFQRVYMAVYNGRVDDVGPQDILDACAGNALNFQFACNVFAGHKIYLYAYAAMHGEDDVIREWMPKIFRPEDQLGDD